MTPIKHIFRPIYAPFVRRWRQAQKVKTGRADIRRQIEARRASGQPVKLVIGSAHTSFEGWISTDLPYLDILKSSDWEQLTSPGTVARVLAEHVFEHLTTDQFTIFLSVVRPMLTDNSRIRIAVPDGYHPDPRYIESVRPGGTGPGADDHKVLYDYQKLTGLMKQAGYDFALLEYHDEQGQFHQHNWDPIDGPIHRSADNDPRNKENPGFYTSLIVDCWPAHK